MQCSGGIPVSQIKTAVLLNVISNVHACIAVLVHARPAQLFQIKRHTHVGPSCNFVCIAPFYSTQGQFIHQDLQQFCNCAQSESSDVQNPILQAHCEGEVRDTAMKSGSVRIKPKTK